MECSDLAFCYSDMSSKLPDMNSNSPIVQALPAVIRGLQARRGLRQEDLAAASGVTQSQVSKILRGVRDPSISQLEAIAHALGTNVPSLWDEANKEATT